MKRTLVAVIAGAVMFVAGLPSTLSASDKDKKEDHIDSFVGGKANDNGLTNEVRHRLIMLPYYGIFDDLGFRVNGSTVILEGQVTRPVLKDDAANTVRKIEGVNNVVNNIEVLPLSPNDDRIRRAEYRAIYGDPTIGDRYGYSAVPSIHIIVKNGNVKLEGVVGSQFDYNLINSRAQGVPGAFKVENNLKIEGK